ncbi:hypothetical protein [Kitasatospora purpeofusca]|uniref:hypothetical protein n=1 Tax=Kitasatospora purpeofusca TaxID=67352 RepID=UPI003666C719
MTQAATIRARASTASPVAVADHTRRLSRRTALYRAPGSASIRSDAATISSGPRASWIPKWATTTDWTIASPYSASTTASGRSPGPSTRSASRPAPSSRRTASM